MVRGHWPWLNEQINYPTSRFRIILYAITNLFGSVGLGV